MFGVQVIDIWEGRRVTWMGGEEAQKKAKIHCGVKRDIFKITRSVVSESVGRTRDGPGARDCRGFVDTSHPTNSSPELSLWEETLIQTQLGTTAAENHQDTSIDLCSCNYDPFFPVQLATNRLLISQQLLYRDFGIPVGMRSNNKTTTCATQPNNRESCDRVPGLAEDSDAHKQLATHARESMNFSRMSTLPQNTYAELIPAKKKL